MPTINAPADVVRDADIATTKAVLNRNNLNKIDRAAMPFESFVMKLRKVRSFTRGRFTQLIQRASDSSLQYILRKERLQYDEARFADEMVWDGARIFKGREIVHADFEDMGYNIVPGYSGNGPGVSKVGPDLRAQLYDVFATWKEELRDAYKVGLDYDFHLDGSQDPLAMPGLDGLLPLNNTLGQIAGKDRSDASFRHIVVANSTTNAGGTLERDLQRGYRIATTFTRGYASAPDAIFAGDDWIDGYVAYAKANGLEYQAQVDKPHGIDIGIPDSKLQWNGIPIVRDPTFRVLDAAGDYDGTPWAKRAYFLSSKTWELAYQEGKDMAMLTPPDPAEQLLSRFGIHSRYALVCHFPRGQMVSTIS